MRFAHCARPGVGGNGSSGSKTALAAVRPARPQYLKIADDFGAPPKLAELGQEQTKQRYRKLGDTVP
jgi:hypothetical protein